MNGGLLFILTIWEWTFLKTILRAKLPRSSDPSIIFVIQVLKTSMFLGLGLFSIVPVTHVFLHIRDAYWLLIYLLLMGNSFMFVVDIAGLFSFRSTFLLWLRNAHFGQLRCVLHRRGSNISGASSRTVRVISFMCMPCRALASYVLLLLKLLLFQSSWYPGRFDIYFSSHQIWHVLIIFAILIHYVGLLNFFEWRIVTPCLNWRIIQTHEKKNLRVSTVWNKSYYGNDIRNIMTLQSINIPLCGRCALLKHLPSNCLCHKKKEGTWWGWW